MQISEVHIHVSHLCILSLPVGPFNAASPPGPYKLQVASNLHRGSTLQETSECPQALPPCEFPEALLIKIDASLVELAESTLNIAVFCPAGRRFASSQAHPRAPHLEKQPFLHL